jgi:PAS domain S-box-containing protein
MPRHNTGDNQLVRPNAEGARVRADSSPAVGGSSLSSETPSPAHRPDAPPPALPTGKSDASRIGTRREPGLASYARELERRLIASVQEYAIIALDPDGYILTWNRGAERYKGWKAEEIIGQHFTAFYPPEDLAWDKPGYELRVAAESGRFEDEGWRLRKDGTRFWANVVITALRDDNGKLIGYGKVTRDLTERRQAEERLRQSEERFRLLIQNVADYGIFMLDPIGRVVSWNEGAERMNGYTAAEIIGRHFSTFYPQEDLDRKKPQFELEQASAHGRFEDEGYRIRKDGTSYWANVIITALRDPSGTLVGFAKVTRDLTERRAATQRAIADAAAIAAEEGARRSAEARAIELATLARQLEARTQEAETANRAKADFLAAMSHELRTPLNAIGGYADLLGMGLRGPVTDEQREDIDRIRKSQQHLLGIINDILNFSRVEAGRVEYEMSPVPLTEVFDSVTAMIEPQATMKHVTYERNGVPDDAIAHADRAKVDQILLNLLSNAVKFTEPGGRISLTSSANGENVFVAVEDTGMGIPEDKIDSIFQPFVQVGRTLTSRQEGTGLGLAISRDLARGMQGDITVESTVGQGSRFTVRLPKWK